MWHFGLNRAPDAILGPLFGDGGGRAYLEWQFRTKAAHPEAVVAAAVEVYWAANSGGGMPLRAGLGYYRALDETMAQNERRKATALPMPVLAVGGALAAGERVGREMALVSADVTAVVVPAVGHYVPEEAPEQLLDAMLAFLNGGRAPNRPSGSGSAEA